MADSDIITNNTDLLPFDIVNKDVIDTIENLNNKFNNVIKLQYTECKGINYNNDKVNDLITRFNKTSTDCIEVSAAFDNSRYNINERPVFRGKLRFHVKFTDRYYGKSRGCSCIKINGCHLLTVDDCKEPKVIYLASCQRRPALTFRSASGGSERRAKSWKLISAIEQIPIEVNVCSCVLKLTKELHAGVIILGEKDKLIKILETQLPQYYSDSVNRLLVLSIKKLFDAKRYGKYKKYKLVVREFNGLFSLPKVEKIIQLNPPQADRHYQNL